MTEKLKTMMEDTAAVEFAVPDLDAIATAGDRTVRRRRAGLAVAGVALLGAASVGGAALWQAADPGEERTQVASSPDAEGLSWGIGSEIRTPDGSIDVGHPVRAYVRTDTGYVTVDPRGQVRSVVGGDITEVGRTAGSSLSLTADNEDSLAAWLEPGGEGRWQWVVFDQAKGERIAELPAGNGPDVTGSVVDLDDRQLFVHEAGSYARLGVDGRSAAATLDRPVPHAQLLAVEDGVLVWADPGNDDGTSSYIVGRTEMEPVHIIPAVQGYEASFSPDARWVAFDADEPRVFDTRTGEQVAIDIGDRVFGAAYEWLDDDTVALIASAGETGPIELLVCQVPSGSCEVAAPDLGSFDDAVEEGFALPTGSEIDD